MKRILIDNAYIAWSTMLRYRNILLDGRDTIQNYISSFYNAVELFSKQAMIDNNDYRVLNIKKIRRVTIGKNNQIGDIHGRKHFCRLK